MYIVYNIDIVARYNIEYSIQDLGHRRSNTRSKILNIVHRLGTQSISVKICSIYRMQELESKTQHIYRMYIVYDIDIVARYNIEYSIQDLGHRRQNARSKILNIAHRLGTKSIEVKICSTYRIWNLESETQRIYRMYIYNIEYSRYKIQYRKQHKGFRSQKIEYKKQDIEYSTQTWK